MSETSRVLQHLNDQFRSRIVTHRQGAFITSGVAALGWEAVERIVRTVATFDDFCHRNDPYSGHDFGCFDAGGHQIFFKIDYYHPDRAVHAPDPANIELCRRVLTLMLAEEY